MNEDILSPEMRKLYDKYEDRRIEHPEESSEFKNAKTDFDEMIALNKKWKTKKGLKVCSLGELIIAEYLKERKIRHFYDASFLIGEDMIRPDFLLSGFKNLLIIEYFGMLDKDDYMLEAEKKLQIYDSQNLYNLISVTNEHLARESVEENFICSFLDKEIKDKGMGNSFFGFFKYFWYAGEVKKP